MSQSVHFQPSLLLIDWEKHKYLSLRTHVGDPGRNPWLQPDPGLAITVARQSIENLSDTLSLRKNAVKHGMKLRPNFFFFACAYPIVSASFTEEIVLFFKYFWCASPKLLDYGFISGLCAYFWNLNLKAGIIQHFKIALTIQRSLQFDTNFRIICPIFTTRILTVIALGNIVTFNYIKFSNP